MKRNAANRQQNLFDVDELIISYPARSSKKVRIVRELSMHIGPKARHVMTSAPISSRVNRDDALATGAKSIDGSGVAAPLHHPRESS
jgi:hypothetical protein